MTPFEAALCGLVQGLAEFLPISSSGHLKLVQHSLGLPDLKQYVFFDLVCHLGTLFAIVSVFFRELLALRKDTQAIRLFLFALFPLIPLAFIRPLLNPFFENLNYLGPFFLVTAAFLFLGETRLCPSLLLRRWSPRRQALWIGCAQTLALVPGISRSGATITAARFCGWDRLQAMRFSFFLALPTILGGIVFEGKGAFMSNSHSTISLPSYIIGFVTSYVVGTLTLRWLLRFARKKSFLVVAWYCLAIGIVTTLSFSL